MVSEKKIDQKYESFKVKLGELGGISYQVGTELMEKAREITMDFSELTRELSKRVDFRYYTPDELKHFQQVDSKTCEEQKTATNGFVVVFFLFYYLFCLFST